MPPKAPPVELAVADIALGSNVREVDQDSTAFQELVASVRGIGMLEPPIVRRHPDGDVNVNATESRPVYQLVAGYRRLAAAKWLKLKIIPVRILELDNLGVTEVQLQENLIRLDLSPMEEAQAVHRYSDAAQLKPKEISKKLHRSESWVRDRLKLLNLGPKGQQLLASGKMDIAHAILLAGFPVEGQNEIIEDGNLPLTGNIEKYDRQEMEQIADGARERAELVTLAKSAKFPVCPKSGCGKPPEQKTWKWTGTSKGEHAVQDSAGHIWNLDTGTTRDRRSTIDASPTVAAERAERKAEKFDRSVCPAVMLNTRPWKIAEDLIKSASDGAVEIRIDREASGGEQRIRMTVEWDGEVPDVLDRKLPYYFGVRLFPYANGTAHITQAVAIPATGKDRKDVLKVVGELAPALPGPEPLKDLPGPLDGSVCEVAQKLGGYTVHKDGQGRSYGKKTKADDWREDRRYIQQLRVTEAAGKNRGSVLDAIDAMLGAKTPTGKDGDY